MATQEHRDEPGLFLQVDIRRNSATVTHAARIPRAPRQSLRPPMLTEKTPPRMRRSSELVVALLDDRGIREQFGWPMTSIAFMDREDEEGTGAIQGQPRHSGLATRVFRIPWAGERGFLLFYTTEFPPEEKDREAREPVQRPLGLYYLGNPEGLIPPVPPLPFPWGPPPIPIPLPFKPPQLYKKPLPRAPRNYLVGSNTLVDSGAPADRFDIVILGDGFTFAELAEFDARAQALADGIMAMPPFNALAGKINIHTVRTTSLQSGISDCPVPGTIKSTYFDVRGNFNGLYPGFVGTSNPERVYQAAEIIAPRDQLEVFLVIANCTIAGGSAFPPQRLAFITMYSDMTKFVNFAAHELAHVIAGNAEEYIGCAEWDPANIYPNQATEADRAANTISWKPLAQPDELNDQGQFRAQHVYGDPFDANHQPVMAPQLQNMLGAFWGCQDIEPGSSSSAACDPYQDARGKGFFRPMAECRMRKSFFNFCRVCAAKITDAINAAAP